MTKISPERIAQIEARRDELQALMATGDLPGDRFVQVSKEYAELEPVAAAAGDVRRLRAEAERSEEHTSELQSLMRISYAVFCLKKKKTLIASPKKHKEDEVRPNPIPQPHQQNRKQ